MNFTIDNISHYKIEEDAEKYIIILYKKPKKIKYLKDYQPGNIVKIGEREYVVLEHKDDNTALLDRNVATEIEFGKNAEWIGSNVEAYCEGDYYNELAKVVGKENIFSHTVNLICDDGSNKNIKVKNRISVLTPNLYRKYREIVPLVNRNCWTPNGVTILDNGYSRATCIVRHDGILGWQVCSCSNGVRPFCILNSNIPIKN